MDKYIRGGLIDSYAHVAVSMSRNLLRAGIDVNSSNALNHLVSDSVFSEIASPTSQELVRRGLPRTNAFEMRRFLATKLLRSRFNISSNIAWKSCMSPLAQQCCFKVMEMERFGNILTYLHGYSISERSGHNGDDTWMQKKNMLRNMNSLEVNMYRRSFEI